MPVPYTGMTLTMPTKSGTTYFDVAETELKGLKTWFDPFHNEIVHEIVWIIIAHMWNTLSTIGVEL